MTPLLICAYKPRYLRAVLSWFREEEIDRHYRIFVWDNGGAAEILREAGLEWHCVRDEATGEPVNVGKAIAMNMLIDIVAEQVPEFDCFACMDHDIVIGRDQLDLLTTIARRPGMGMIAGCFHPFNAPPAGGTVVSLSPGGPRLMVYPAEDRTVRNMGRIAGGVFALPRSALQKLPWAPRLYPVLLNPEQKPVVYWTEDASLDCALTVAGLTNGYLYGSEHEPALELPELNTAYATWKRKAIQQPPVSDFFGPDE